MNSDRLQTFLVLSVWIGLFIFIFLAWWFQHKAQRFKNEILKTNFEKEKEEIENRIMSTPIADVIEQANKRKRDS